MDKSEIEFDADVVPRGYLAKRFGSPSRDDDFLNPEGVICRCSSCGWSFGPRLILEKIWQPPANVKSGLKFFPSGSRWYVTTCEVFKCDFGGDWVSEKGYSLYADEVFKDFTPPPERRPYTVH